MIIVALLAQVLQASPAPARANPHDTRVMARVHRVWDPATGEQLAIAPFQLNVITWGSRDSVRFEVELRPESNTRPAPESLAHTDLLVSGRAAIVTGAVAGPIPVEADFWRVVARENQPFRESLATFRLARLGAGAFALSDLIVGVEGKGPRWLLGADTVAMAPQAMIVANERIQLFYQMRSAAPLRDLRTRLIITRVVENESQDDQVLTIAFSTPNVPAGITAEQRDIDVSRFTGSRYRVDVTVSTATGRLLGAARGMLELVR
ncbi:MAG: hypothetical protein ABIZ70_13830 [Gemmatimonadales bacterium]